METHLRATYTKLWNHTVLHATRRSWTRLAFTSCS